MQTPLVSIIIPTYNRAHLIGETLDSVLAQTYTNWECIVVDDGSTDDTDKLLAEYCEKDSRFQYHHRPKDRLKGGNAARNYGFELCKGEYVKWFDSDDLMKEALLEKQLQLLLNNSKLDFCATFWIHLYEDGSTMKNKQNTDDYSQNPIKAYLLDGHIFPTPSPLWRVLFLNGKKLFDENLQRSQEADFHFNMLMFNPTYDFVYDFLMYVRIGNHDSIKNDTSISSKLSVFKYFNNVFTQIYRSTNIDKNIILEYVFYRQCVNYYEILSSCNTIHERKTLSKELFPSIKKQTTNFFKRRLFVELGNRILIYFKKGYYFFYYPKFNHRKK